MPDSFLSGFPHLLNNDLSTVGLYDYDGALQPGDALTAHPKVCPVTGEMLGTRQSGLAKHCFADLAVHGERAYEHAS